MPEWDERNGVLVDYMMYPISKKEALALRKQLLAHLKKTPAELAEIANRQLKKDMPHYDPFTPEQFE